MLITRNTSLSCREEKATMDDMSLVQQFILGCRRGENVLLTNPNLHTEPSARSVQLLTKRGEVVATAKLGELRLHFVVNHNCCFAPLAHEQLLKQSFFPLAEQRTPRFFQYFAAEVPQGYRSHWTSVRELWRTSWIKGGLTRTGIPMDLLIYTVAADGRQLGWQAIRGMDCEHGSLVIKLLGQEQKFAPEDMVAWLEKVALEVPLASLQARQGRSDSRGYWPTRH
jgi:hypothetical protein